MSSPQEPQQSPGPGAPQAYGPPQGYAPPQGYPPPQGYAPPQPQQYAQPQQHGQQPSQPYAQPSQPSAPQGQTRPYGDAPTGELVVDLRKPFGGAGWVTPVLSIDGFPATASWGRNVFPAPAGVRQVDAASTYLWTFGRASMPVTVEPGRTSEVHYTGPMWTFGMGGRMGTEVQKRPGMGLFIGLMSFVGLVLLLAILVGVTSG
ncbi:hypothetical protein [Microlunatus flavus]|nr:hypothetical protein [Microlunatus flavus]